LLGYPTRPYSTEVRRKPHHRGFSLLELAAVAAIVGVAAGIAIGLGSRTAQGLDDQQNQYAVLDYIQRERNAHVNRGMEEEVLVICTAVGGVCAPSGNELIAFRKTIADPLPPPPASELSRQAFVGQFQFVGGFLVVDAYARSVNALGAPTANTMTLTQKQTNQSIVFRADGAVVPTFDATSALVVAPKIADIGARTTPNPTPFGSSSGVPRAREVFLE